MAGSLEHIMGEVSKMDIDRPLLVIGLVPGTNDTGLYYQGEKRELAQLLMAAEGAIQQLR